MAPQARFRRSLPSTPPLRRARPYGGCVMDSAWVNLKKFRHSTEGANRPEGFSLLEMMIVVTVILIVASISAPIYMTAVVRAREAVLADHLFTLRALIDRFTLDPADAGPRSCLAPRNRGKRLSGKNPNRPLHRIKRNLAGGEGRRAPLTNANGAGDRGRAQRLEPRFTRRHAVQQLVIRGFRIQESGVRACRGVLADPTPAVIAGWRKAKLCDWSLEGTQTSLSVRRRDGSLR